MSGEQPPESVRNGQGVGESFDCGIDEKLLYRYIYGSVNAAEEREVQSHLANCKLCLDEVIAITKVLHQPPTEEEKAAFRKVAMLNPEARLQRVMAKVDELYPSEMEENEDGEEAPGINVWERVKIWWEAREPVPHYALVKTWWEAQKPIPRYALALSLFFIGIFASLFTYQVVFKNGAETYYVFDDRVPYDYDTSGLRSSQAPVTTDSLLQAFVNQFKLGMADYMMREYASAIQTLQTLEPAALTLQAQSDSEKALPWLRDFYFYYGLSHLALSRSRQAELGDEIKTRHATQAIRWLARADSLVTARHLESDDRENYFLGLAYGLGGQKDLAIAQLHQIKPGSRFYSDSVKLIQEWSNQ